MPSKVVQAYARYHENVSIHNSIAGGLGDACHKNCSIPQGCPFSMCFMALLMRPWILVSRITGVIPRVLADAILLVAVAPLISRETCDLGPSQEEPSTPYGRHSMRPILICKTWELPSQPVSRCSSAAVRLPDDS